jgi:hypothetical protein
MNMQNAVRNVGLNAGVQAMAQAAVALSPATVR